MTVQDLIKTALTDPTKLFDPSYLEGEVYVVNFTKGEIKIQAVYSGELVRMLPEELVGTAQLDSSGYTQMTYWDGGKFVINITLT